MKILKKLYFNRHEICIGIENSYDGYFNSEEIMAMEEGYDPLHKSAKEIIEDNALLYNPATGRYDPINEETMTQRIEAMIAADKKRIAQARAAGMAAREKAIYRRTGRLPE